MYLSPLNRFGIAARLLQGSQPTEDRHRIEEVVMYRCPKCRELHEWESDAKDCCKEAVQLAPCADGPNCPVCGEEYQNHRDAADCCLWKDLDAYTRWAVADAVEAGSEWATELGLTPNV